MSLIGKLIGMVLAGNALADSTPLFHRLLSGVAVIVGLAIVSALLATALLFGVMYAGFEVLVQRGGQSPDAALLEIAIATVIILGICISQIVKLVEEFKTIPVQILELQSPVTMRAQNVISAFMDGFSKGKKNEAKVYPFKKSAE